MTGFRIRTGIAGTQIGANAAVTAGRMYWGFWRVGGDNLGRLAVRPDQRLPEGNDRRSRCLPDSAIGNPHPPALHLQRPVKRRPRSGTAADSHLVASVHPGGKSVVRQRLQNLRSRLPGQDVKLAPAAAHDADDGTNIHGFKDHTQAIDHVCQDDVGVSLSGTRRRGTEATGPLRLLGTLRLGAPITGDLICP